MHGSRPPHDLPTKHRQSKLSSVRARHKAWRQTDIAPLAHAHLVRGERGRRPARLILQLPALDQDDEVEFDDSMVAIADTRARACGGLGLERELVAEVADVDLDVAEYESAWWRSLVSLVPHWSMVSASKRSQRGLGHGFTLILWMVILEM
jgi:hypothetical protein